MLTAIRVENFKSWRKIDDMRLAPITGLFGSNSSGKTSILQLLLMLKQTVESPDRAQVLNLGDERSLAALGTFSDVVHQHQKPGSLSWTVSWDLPKELKIMDPQRKEATLLSGNKMDFLCSVTEGASGQVMVDHMIYMFSEYLFGMMRKHATERKYDLLGEDSSGAFQFKRTRGRAWDLPAPVKFYGFPDQVKAYYQNAGFLSDFELAFEELFSRIYYLGPLREYPRREYTWAGAQPADMGQRGEKVVDALLAAQGRGKDYSLGYHRKRMTLEEIVAWWLRELGLIHDFSVKRIDKKSNLYRVLVKKTPIAAEVLVTDVGFGVSQILPVLVLCYYVPKGSTILLEQPEIHLHPSVQAGLADVLINAVITRNVQIIVESHSEHLLRRLQLRIAEDRLSAKKTSLYFCNINRGVSELIPLDINMFGEITNWPEDFFGNAFGEMAAMTRASMERQKQQQA